MKSCFGFLKKRSRESTVFRRGTNFHGELGPLPEDPHDVLKRQYNSDFLMENAPAVLSKLSKFNIDMPSLVKFKANFENAMKKGLETPNSFDLKMLPTYVTKIPNGKEVGQYLALDLGGTNFRVLLLKMNGNSEKKQLISKGYGIPEYIMKSTGDELFGFIADKIAAFIVANELNGAERLNIGFTFSFPCEQISLSEGNLISWTKGFDCPDVIGKDVVRMLQNAIDERKLNARIVALVNDTVGTLMATAYTQPNTAVGMIVGTGTNACYLEKVKNLNNLTRGPMMENDEFMVINTEWGAYGDTDEEYNLRQFSTTYDEEIDESSINPGRQRFEKMVSGMYIGELVRLIIVDLYESKLLFTNYKPEP